MTAIEEDEFRDLVRQVRSLERTVEEQQKQIAKLKQRTTTDTGVQSSPSSTSSDEVPRSSVELQVLDTLKDNAVDQEPLSVEQIKNDAAQAGELRSEARIVVKNWINDGYLTGDVEGSVTVVEFPSETVPVED